MAEVKTKCRSKLHVKRAGSVKVEMVQGVEGMAIYVNDYRICGPKPWGGGRVVRKWMTDVDRVIEGLNSKPTN